MRLQDALAELKRNPDTHVMWRSEDIVAYSYSADASVLSIWFACSYLDKIRAEGPTHEPLPGAVGFGIEIFSVADVEHDDWVVRPLADARAAGYTDDTHDPVSCAECVRERAREHGAGN